MLFYYQCFCFLLFILPTFLGSCVILSVVCEPFDFDDCIRILVVFLVMGIVLFGGFHVCFMDPNSFIFKLPFV